MPDEVILIDAYSQIFRAFFAIRMLTNSRGEPTNALFVFTRLLLHIQQTYSTARGAMLFDCGKVGFRLELNPEYKANRPPMPDALRAQIPVIRTMAEAFGWPLLEEPEFEADDLIAAIARAATDAPVRIVSSDKDLAQLVDDRVHMLSPAAGNAGFEERGTEEIVKKFSVPPSLIVDYLSLIGDSSDNIPGVPGIGPKSAAQLLTQFGPIEQWIDHPERLAGSKFEKKLAGTAELLRRNRKLIQLRQDLPARFRNLDALLHRNEPDWNKIAGLCREYELKSILKELPPDATADPDDLFAAAAAEPPEPPRQEEKSGGMVQGELF